MASSSSHTHIAEGHTEIPPTAHHFFNTILEQTPGNSKLQIPKAFWVKYCDSLSSQVKLPCGSRGEIGLTESSDGKKHNVDVDSSNENSELSWFSKTRDKPPLPCSWPHKKRKISPYGKSEESSVPRRIKPQKIIRKQILRGQDKAEALMRAKGFKSNDPFFIVLMQPSFVGASYNMVVPFSFAKNHPPSLSKPEDVILKVQDERIWPVRYYYRKYAGHSQFRFEWGWKAFARDNDLKVGDVCVFVKRQNIAIMLFEVVTFYKNGVPNSPVLPAANNTTLCVKVEPSFTSNNYDNASMISHDIIPKKEVIEPSVNKSDKVCGESPLPENFIRNQELSRKEKDEALKIAKDFKSEDPFFIVPMQPSFVGSKSKYSMIIPSFFAKNYLLSISTGPQDVILKVQDGRTWPAKYTFYFKPHKKSSSFRIQRGWKAFVQENDLKVGDVCAFVLTKNIGIILFEVFIFHNNGVANSPMAMLSIPAANKRSSTTPSKPKITPCAKIEPSFTSDYDKASMISEDLIAKKIIAEPSVNESDKVCGESPVPKKFIRNQELSRKEKAEAFQRAKDFKSEDPFFIVPMQPSFVGSKSKYCLGMPSPFAKKYLFGISSTPQDVILTVKDGRTWSVKYYVRPRGVSSKTTIEGGWKAFVQDNDLKVGDVCAFVLRKSIGVILFEVSILPIPAANKRSSTPYVEIEPSSTSNNYDKASMIPHDIIANKEVIEPSEKVTKPVSEENTGSQGTNNKRPSSSGLSIASKAASKFFSNNPFFQVNLRSTHVRGHGQKLYIPMAIANPWFEKKSQIVTLWVDEEHWHVNLTINKASSSSGLEYRFSGGWAAFARDNSLNPSDVCIFELIKKNKPEVKVTIFRQSESDMAQE
ncbi:hypothetical protein CsatB_024458 [Cannabis sativa]